MNCTVNWVKLPNGYQKVEQVGDYILAYNPGTLGPRYVVWREGDVNSAEYFHTIVTAVEYYHQQWGAAA